jgi:hypothetical protein
MAKKKYKKLTLGHIREMTKDLPDSTRIYPDWYKTPGNYEPGVSIKDLDLGKGVDGSTYLSIKVALFSLR